MFVGILLCDPACDFGVVFENLRHRKIFKISVLADKKLKGATLSFNVMINYHLALKCLWEVLSSSSNGWIRQIPFFI